MSLTFPLRLPASTVPTSTSPFAFTLKDTPHPRDIRDAGGNIAWAAFYSFAKLAAKTTGLSPPGRILNSLEEPENFSWCEAFVSVLDAECTTQEHQERVIDTRSTKDWLDNTNQLFESTRLKEHYLASLVEADKATGFNTLPLSKASQDFYSNQQLAAVGEVEPSIKARDVVLSRKGRISTRSSNIFANGCPARALVTTEATKAASISAANLLEFTVEGVTCFRNRIAPTFIEAAAALQLGGHSDFLHRDFTFCSQHSSVSSLRPANQSPLQIANTRIHH